MQPQGHQVDRLLRRIAAEGAGDDAVVARAVELLAGVSRALVPIIGQRGMAALYERALHLAAVEHPWLGPARGVDGEPPDFSPLAGAAAGHSLDDAIAAFTFLFATFDRLLVTLIGAPLSERLLQPVWDVPSAGPTRQDPAP